jgi:probable Rubsico expression protein CbbX
MIPPRDMDRILSFGSKQARKRAQHRARRGDPDHNLLPPEASIALAAEREATGIDGILAALEDDLIGLAPIKQKVNEIASLLLVDRARRRFGLDAPRPNLHMCFTGSPGTGKTTVALRMASLLKQLGYLEQGQLVHAMRNDLIGEYIGQTAPRTKRVLDKAMGGVLFIDEAYYLYNKHDPNDFGQEAVGILLQVMENDRDKLVVILAGYKDRMDEFFSSNPGMSSRIAHHLDFVDYELGELLSIGEVMLSQSNYYLSPDAEAVLKQQLSRQMGDPRFSNARSVRNDLDRARLRHAFRLSAEPDRLWGRDDLMRLEPFDVTDDEPG